VHTDAQLHDLAEPAEPEPEPVRHAGPTHRPRYLWCIRAGHGRKQRGKRSPRLEDGKRFEEWRWNRDIKDRILAELDERGVQYFDVVPEDNVGSFLLEAVKRANQKQSDLPKVYLSIHANAGPAPNSESWQTIAHGTETWYYHFSARGRRAAQIFQRHLVAATGFRNRHLRSRPTQQFYELRATKMVAILTESGFYNHPIEVHQLMDPAMMDAIAAAHVDAIMEIEETGMDGAMAV
jgi:N-acetylmuramoyl-L-alanine amidase